MKTIQKLLILSIIVSLIVFVFACKSDTEQNQGVEQNGGSETSGTNESGRGADESNEGESQTESFMLDLPDITFDGDEFVMHVRGLEQNAAWHLIGNFYAEEQNGEQLNDAVYNRNRKIEEKFDIKLTVIQSNGTTGTAAHIASLIAAGDDSVDVFVPPMYQTSPLITKGLFTNLRDVPYIDLDKPWWDQNANRDLSINGKLYVTIGDIAISTMDATSTVYFNKTIHAGLNLEDMYNLVREGKWTLDKMSEMSRQALKDLNGDGVYDKDDQFGLVAQETIVGNYFFASGENVTINDANGLPVSSVNNPRAINAIGKVIDVLAEGNGAYTGKDEVTAEIFRNGQGLFYSHVLDTAERLRAEEINFGIVPMPKLDETQERYYNFADSWCMCLIGIPVTNNNLERAGVILEALAAESMYTMVPVYYETNLSNQFFRDDDSIEMLEIIRETRVLSIDSFYEWGMTDTVRDIINKGDSNAVVSKIDSSVEKFKSKIDKTIETIENLDSLSN